MGSIFDEVRTLQQQATLDRKRGEALRKAAREPEARQAFDAGIAKLGLAEKMLESGQSQDPQQFAERRAENFGSVAGLLRRVGRYDEAYKKYREGATVELDFNLAKTYNRVNEIKYALLTGRESVAEVEARTRMTADQLLSTLTNPATLQLGDDGWAWADLGDCRGLIGELTEATRAYSTFKDKAGSQAPATTLEVLQNIADALAKRGDPDRDRVTNMMTALRSLMGASPATGPR
jgi:tetratricopeptide (TPR) repeat protein